MSLDLPTWLVQSITSLGVAGGPVMFFFWFLEYRQRVKWQDDLLDRNEKFINSANDMANALKAVTASVAGAQDTLKTQNTLIIDMAGTLRILSKRNRE